MKKLLAGFLILNFMACSPSKQGDEMSSNSQIIRIEKFKSDYVEDRTVQVFLPSNYNVAQKYAVLYMHDGQMLFDKKNTWNGQSWNVGEVLDSLITENKAKPTIVVGIDNAGALRHAEYFPQKALAYLDTSANWLNIPDRANEVQEFAKTVISDNYLKFLVEELKTYIDSNFSTASDPGNTAIMGSSMGGLISLYALTEYPDVFGSAACLSTHWTELYTNENNPYPSALLKYLETKSLDPQNLRLYFDYGTETLDSLYEPHQLKVDDLMSDNSFNALNYKSLKFEGANHTEDAWSERLHIPLQFILAK